MRRASGERDGPATLARPIGAAPRRPALTLETLACVAAILGTVTPAAAGEPLGATVEREPRLSLSDVVLSEFAGAQLARRTSAARLVVVPRRLGPFRVLGLEDVIVSRARVEVFLVAGADARRIPRDVFAVGWVKPALGGSVTLHDVEWVFEREGAPLTRVAASRATVDLRSGNATFLGLSVTHVPSSRVLRAERAEWRGDVRRLTVRGAYHLDGGEGAPGQAAEFDLELGDGARR